MLFSFAVSWAYSILLLESVLLLFLIEKNKPGWCTISMLSTFGLLKLLAGVNVFGLAWHHPGLAVLAVFGYLGGGVAWAIIKWYLYVRSRREKYEEAKNNWHNRQVEPGSVKIITWEISYERGRFLNSKKGLAPLVRDNKWRVFTWMGYWPWSMAWTVINDPIKKIWEAIYSRIHDALQTISNSAFKDVN